MLFVPAVQVDALPKRQIDVSTISLEIRHGSPLMNVTTIDSRYNHVLSQTSPQAKRHQPSLLILFQLF